MKLKFIKNWQPLTRGIYGPGQWWFLKTWTLCATPGLDDNAEAAGVKPMEDITDILSGWDTLVAGVLVRNGFGIPLCPADYNKIISKHKFSLNKS